MLALILAIGTSASSSVNAAQLNPPLADVFSFDYPDPWPGFFLTYGAGDKARANLKDTGYTAFNNRNKSAGTAMTWAKDDAVWAFFGHARPGGVLFYHGDGTSYSELLANSDMTVIKSGVAKVSLSSYTWNDLHDLRLMVFAGCNTAKDGKPGSLDDGNLSRVAFIRKGVDSTIAFQGLVHWPVINGWGDAFFARLRMGDTVNQAAQMAVSMMIYSYGWEGGFDSWWTIGGTLKIKPAGYGS
jgi:hypothetical protein